MDLQDILKQSIQGEIDGRELYKAAADKCDDDKAKEVFQFLAEEEDSHIKALQKIYKSYTENKELKIELPERKIEFADTENPIFSKNFKERLKGKHFEISSLSIGMRLEMDSYKFYADMADQAYDIKLKDFFKTLSEWEKSHYNALSREMESLQSDYFNENNFAPF